MIKYLIFTILITFSLTVHPYEKTVLLRGGATATFGGVKSFDDSDNYFWGGGINANAGYRFSNLTIKGYNFNRFEINASGNSYWGKINHIKSELEHVAVDGTAAVRTFVIAVYLKYHFDTLYKKIWQPYVGLGPSWSQHTLKMKDYQVTKGSFNGNNRIAYLTEGATLVFGIEENLPYKEMHPVFMEFTYTFTAAQKVSLLDASNHKEIESIEYENIDKHVYSHIIMFNMGMTIF
ncbi:MAG: hypothetical protein A2202_09280 [Bdellovibrionales bacterium RIFOXYA1_FULL_36_14]|nr:MAG: hypothetical protein A2202_09280 [Bdellovibrionales bacterium RIFOXYA1_FULL_36_14]